MYNSNVNIDFIILRFQEYILIHYKLFIYIDRFLLLIYIE